MIYFYSTMCACNTGECSVHSLVLLCVAYITAHIHSDWLSFVILFTSSYCFAIVILGLQLCREGLLSVYSTASLIMYTYTGLTNISARLIRGCEIAFWYIVVLSIDVTLFHWVWYNIHYNDRTDVQTLSKQQSHNWSPFFLCFNKLVWNIIACTCYVFFYLMCGYELFEKIKVTHFPCNLYLIKFSWQSHVRKQ